MHAANPSLLLGLILLAANAPFASANQDPSTTQEAAIIEEFATLLKDQAAAGKFSGTALLARGNEILFETAYGLASRRHNVPNNVGTRFHMGSMSKMFTGVAICQLAEEGKLKFEDLVEVHLPDYPNFRVAETVTIHHLLSHTSGMGDYLNDAFRDAIPSLETISDLLPLFAEDDLAFEPGTRWSYSNAGPVVLGLIIEAITGENYFDYVGEHVLARAGMTSSGHWPLHLPTPNLATGYTRFGQTGGRDRKWISNIYIVGNMASPAGGAYTTVGDMLRFSRALQSGKLLSAEMFATMTKVRNASGRGMKYGYLHAELGSREVQIFGHPGGGPGVSTNFSYQMESGYTMVVLSNIDAGTFGLNPFVKKSLVAFGAAAKKR